MVLYRFLALIEALAELLPLLWQNECFRQEVEVLLREPLLHLDSIDCEAVLSGKLRARREVINLLVLIESFVEVVLALCVSPKHIPVMAVCRDQTVYFKNEAHKLRLTLEHLIVDSRLTYLRVDIGGSTRRLRCLREVCLIVD